MAIPQTLIFSEPRDHNEYANQSMVAFEEAATQLDLEPRIVQRLRHPLSETTVYLQVARDAGEAVCVPFFALRHSDRSGCAAGSLILAPGLQQRDCRVLGMERTWQSALLDLPLGGAAFALVCDPDEWSERELVAIIPPLARHLSESRPGVVLFPGEGCCREFMGRLASQLRGEFNVKITGKPGSMGGLDHDRFAAEGIAALVSALLRHAGFAAVGAKVAMQGFGSLARAVGQRLLREKMQIVALSDGSGAICRADGLILDDVAMGLTHEPRLLAYKEADHLRRDELFGVEADVLLLTSDTNELSEKNCKDVTAKVIIEANAHTIRESAKKLLSPRTIVAPHFVSTCGELLGSYFEAQGSGLLETEEELLKRSYGIVGHAVGRVLHALEHNHGRFEQAAYRLAVESAASYLRAGGS